MGDYRNSLIVTVLALLLMLGMIGCSRFRDSLVEGMDRADPIAALQRPVDPTPYELAPREYRDEPRVAQRHRSLATQTASLDELERAAETQGYDARQRWYNGWRDQQPVVISGTRPIIHEVIETRIYDRVGDGGYHHGHHFHHGYYHHRTGNFYRKVTRGYQYIEHTR